MATELKCIICDQKAEYIHLIFGNGGSFCKEHLEERKKDVDDIKEKLDKVK